MTGFPQNNNNKKRPLLFFFLPTLNFKVNFAVLSPNLLNLLNAFNLLSFFFQFKLFIIILQRLYFSRSKSLIHMLFLFEVGRSEY